MSVFKVDLPTPEFKKFGKLPGKPSELITLAVNDLKASEKAGFKVDMSDWLVAKANSNRKFCTVCFAGAVMAQSLGKAAVTKQVLKHKGTRVTKNDDLYFDYDGTATMCKVSPSEYKAEQPALSALNMLREGEIENAFTELDIEFPSDVLEDLITVTQYEEDKIAFKSEMLKLASDLARIGY